MRLIHKIVLVLGLALGVPTVMVGLAASASLRGVEDHATAEASRSLRDAEMRSIERLASERALAIQAFLAGFEEDVELIRRAWEEATRPDVRVPAAEVYPNPGLAGLPGYGRIDPVVGAYADWDRRGPGSAWLPRYAVAQARQDPAARTRLVGELHRAMQLTPLLRDVAARNPGTVDLMWVVMADGPANALPPYDYVSIVAEDPRIADLVEADEDYVRLAGPAENPERRPRWIEPYFDEFKHVWMTSRIAPLYTGDVFEGSVGLDVLLATIGRRQRRRRRPDRETLQVGDGPGTFAFLVAGSGQLVATSPAGIDRLAVGATHAAALRRSLAPGDGAAWPEDELAALEGPTLASHPDAALRGLAAAMQAGERVTTELTLGGRATLVATAPVPSAGWWVAVAIPVDEALAGVEGVRSAIRANGAAAQRQLGVFAAAVLAIGLVAGGVLHALTIRPLTAFTQRVGELSWDRLDFPTGSVRRSDEIGQLNRKFGELVTLIRAARGNLVKELGERDEAVRQLEATRAALEEADRHKDRFLAMLGHELRNPLFSIRTAVELLGRVGQRPEALGPVVAVIDRQSAHMARIVDGLLDVSRVARGKLALDRKPCDLSMLVRRCVDDRAEAIAAHRLEVSVDVPDALWVDGDEVRLSQVVANLVGNAVKFTDPGGHVVVTATQEEEEAVVRVRDDGVGIAEDVLPHLFEPFRQAPQDLARSEGGLGLGLALAKGLVELHGGRIEAHSGGPGTGAEFVVRLPCCAPPLHASAPAGAARSGAVRVLVVEDNADAADLLSLLLAQAGHDVLAVARTGPEALTRIGAERPAVVLCDLGLPGLSGYDVARAVRADPALRDTMLVALSGYGQPEDVQEARAAGFDAHLTKPVDVDAIEELLAARARK